MLLTCGRGIGKSRSASMLVIPRRDSVSVRTAVTRFPEEVTKNVCPIVPAKLPWTWQPRSEQRLRTDARPPVVWTMYRFCAAAGWTPAVPMAIRTAKMSKLRFIEYIPPRGLLQVFSTFGAKGYPQSVADSSFWANGTSVTTVTITRTNCLWYLRTIGQISEEFDVARACHTFLPGKFPRALRSEITMDFSP